MIACGSCSDVLKMIEMMEMVDTTKLDQFKAQFAKHDKDGTGKLDK